MKNSDFYSEYGRRIIFGKYPQSVVDDPSLISEIMNEATIDKDGLYLLNDEKYAKVKFGGGKTSFKNGTSPQFEKEYFFKFEPISWLLLKADDGKMLLFSEMILDYLPFDSNFSRKYENSQIRKFLNEDFLNVAFNEEEKSLILKSTVDNNDDCSRGFGRTSTNDYLFLISLIEARTENEFIKDDWGKGKFRSAEATDFCKAKGCFSNVFWLRTDSCLHFDVLCTNDLALISLINKPNFSCGIRPACWIKK